MCFSQVTTRIVNKGVPGEVWFVFETPHATLEEQTARMIADGGLSGTRHETVPEGWVGRRPTRRITESFHAFIDRSAIVAVTELRHTLKGADGNVLA